MCCSWYVLPYHSYNELRRLCCCFVCFGLEWWKLQSHICDPHFRVWMIMWDRFAEMFPARVSQAWHYWHLRPGNLGHHIDKQNASRHWQTTPREHKHFQDEKHGQKCLKQDTKENCSWIREKVTRYCFPIR